MSLHPLIELSNDSDVKKAKGFKEKAAELTGERLEEMYQQEVGQAPDRASAGKKYLGVRTSRTPSGPQAGKDDRHFALALDAWAKAGDRSIELPGGEALALVDCTVPLRTAAPDRALGDQDPNKGVEDIDVLGLLPDDRVAVVRTKFLAASATRGGAGDTPLRALLSGLAQAAMVDARRAAIGEAIENQTGRKISDEAPALILAGSPRYWEICRKREAQKGAAWIRELERLGREIATSIGVEVFFLGLSVGADPAWRYEETGPVLEADPDCNPAWESGAGKLKPKPKARARKLDPANVIVEADPSRPSRPYRISDTFESGDTLVHPKLGTGVVQGVVGRGKIAVLFGEEKKLLVHERGQ